MTDAETMAQRDWAAWPDAGAVLTFRGRQNTIARRLLAEDDNPVLSVSATTRLPRPNEADGRDYHFVDMDRFDAMVADNAFLEYAEVFGNFYGTPKADVMAVLERGGDVLFDIDWQGTQQVANAARDDLVFVFVLPRRERHFRTGWLYAQDSEEVGIRMAKA